MNALPVTVAAAIAAACCSLPAAAQGDAGQCIVAGRVNAGEWAPKFAGVQLVGSDGKAVTSAARQALGGVKQARLARPALLSRCDGNAALRSADQDAPRAKAPAPALSAGLVDVEAVAFPKLRTGGELVELRVRVPGERVVMLR